MAVYTHVSAEMMARFLNDYDTGELISFKGIAEGVENSNFLVETRGGADGHRFILTLYEKRVDPADLPFFMALLDHLAMRGCRVPRAIADRTGVQIKQLAGRRACLIEFLEGISLSTPNPAQATAAGEALAEMHIAVADFDGSRPNSMGLASWHDLASRCAGQWQKIDPALEQLVSGELAYLQAQWPTDLPQSVIHADLFPDNVLMLGDTVSGLIDFYFSCTDARAYDLAVTHSAWCFSSDGASFDPGLSAALLRGYRDRLVLTPDEQAALPVLARGAALRFTLSRAYDWINTPADAMVTRKDPMAFARRALFYADPANAGLFA
ncbi:homoserine kinase [Blastomonas aquatica]|uniref:Homoserine kinase n=1 Tax=Blastomonas aquatica TaxID=1510276 RepID=A0ABQ1ISR1_9SPHN|nr:homoserine kinase [Blastomonas aquatica]GGB50319.1 homoserine kinase [Blastomonas aquatica]